ncbi:hypothetical protein EDC04DRAFT_2653847, partial [Pisolithus marmoratus]
VRRSSSPNGKVVSGPHPNTPGSIPRPSPQTEQRSRTMQHALQMMGGTQPPQSLPFAALPGAKHGASAVSTVTTSATPLRPKLDGPAVTTVYSPQSNPDTPPTHGAKSASSISVANDLSRLCGATTKSNKQCSRTVKLPLHMQFWTLCPTTGFYVTRVGRIHVWLRCPHRRSFLDYVPEYLRVDTQLALKEEMARAPSRSDRPDPSAAHLIQLKVGRTVNLKKRLDQWDKQCGSREQVLRGWWPGTVEPDSDNGANGSLLRAQMRAGDPGPLCHRLERLVHIELADLSLYAPYLEPDKFPSTALSAVKRANRCPDCTYFSLHNPSALTIFDQVEWFTREIFSFRRPDAGQYEGREWDLIVKPVIEKWGRFVKEYYS